MLFTFVVPKSNLLQEAKCPTFFKKTWIPRFTCLFAFQNVSMQVFAMNPIGVADGDRRELDVIGVRLQNGVNRFNNKK